MTRQEIFDIVAAHLVAQGRRAWHGNTCVYRAPNGDRCAIGRLIPDDLYVPELEGNRVKDLLDRDPDIEVDAVDALLATFERLGIDEGEGDFLSDLQRVHDAEPNWLDIDGALRGFATRWGLARGA